MLSDEKLEKIKKLLDEIAPGNWIFDPEEFQVFSDEIWYSDPDYDDMPCNGICIIAGYDEMPSTARSNGEFIAQAKNIINELLSEVERLREENKELRSLVEYYRSMHDLNIESEED